MAGPYTADKTNPTDTSVISQFPANERAMRSDVEDDLNDRITEKDSVAVICDQKTAGTGGGTFTSATDVTRDLNTEIFDSNGLVTIASNQFTLGAGTYIIEWSAPANGVNQHKSWLYDVTGTAAIEYGTSENALNNAGSGNATQSRSFGVARIAPGSSNVYEIRHRCGFTKASNGLGIPASDSQVEKYTMVKITRLT